MAVLSFPACVVSFHWAHVTISLFCLHLFSPPSSVPEKLMLSSSLQCGVLVPLPYQQLSPIPSNATERTPCCLYHVHVGDSLPSLIPCFQLHFPFPCFMHTNAYTLYQHTLRIQKHTYIYTIYVYTFIHTYTHIHIHTCTQTHIHQRHKFTHITILWKTHIGLTCLLKHLVSSSLLYQPWKFSLDVTHFMKYTPTTWFSSSMILPYFSTSKGGLEMSGFLFIGYLLVCFSMYLIK